MKWWWVLVFLGAIIVGALVIYRLFHAKTKPLVSPAVNKILEKPFDKYSIGNLSKRSFSSQITLDDAVATTSAYIVYKFHFGSDHKKITGLAHIPNSCDAQNQCPTIVQFRGYVDVDNYQPGVGTRKSAEVFATNGFISLAPDFLGYGGSDNPSANVFEARFETYITALNLLAGVGSLPQVDANRVGIWGHSNGGQIALTVLEIMGNKGQRYPTVLWAPVSKPFPYSILYYTDEADDKGKALRKELAKFEQDYDVFSFDLTRYLNNISAPVQLHQGTADDAVPLKWSQDLVKSLQDLAKDITYYEYPGADHNLSGAWNLVVQRNIEFFHKHFAN